MLRIIAWSVAEATAFVLAAAFCWSLFSHFVERSPDDGLALIVVMYFLPIAVAVLRKHKATLDVMVINLWLGWTVIGWFIVMIWACKGDAEVEAVAE